MPKNTLISSPVQATVSVEIQRGVYKISPKFVAFSTESQPKPQNLVLLIDHSSSMADHRRLEYVKMAVPNLLHKLSPQDTFSIMGFNSSAEVLVARQLASKNAINDALAKINALQATGGTNFLHAFNMVEHNNLLPPENDSTLIFLTDGEDRYSAIDLFNKVKDKKFLRIVPIGILDSGKTTVLVLNELASKTGNQALYIINGVEADYQKAFDAAYQAIFTSSDNPAQLRMTLQADDKINTTTLSATRALDRIRYNGSSISEHPFYFDSKVLPRRLTVEIDCDNRILQAQHTFTEEEHRTLSRNCNISIHINAFKWKNNSTYSWIISIGNIALGCILLASATLFLLSFPQLTFAVWQPLVMASVAALSGAFLLVCGLLAVSRKTLFLPTKLAEKEVAGIPKSIGQTPFYYAPKFFARALVGTTAVGCGAISGCYISTLPFSSAALVATGISPFLFMAGCATTGAIALPILLYGCVQLGMHPLIETNRPSMR